MPVWMALDMTGLEPARHVIVEIATIITDDHLETVAEGPDLVIHANESELAEMDEFVREMPTKSGLDRKSVVQGKSVDLGGRLIIKKKKK